MPEDNAKKLTTSEFMILLLSGYLIINFLVESYNSLIGADFLKALVDLSFSLTYISLALNIKKPMSDAMRKFTFFLIGLTFTGIIIMKIL